MSTKNNPGAFRCYEAALPDEHVFTILARDPAGPATLEFWADERERMGKTKNPDDIDRIADARRDAELMRDWRAANLDPSGDGPTWKLVKITDDDGGPIRIPPDNVQYVPAERDGDEAVRLNVEWLRARARDLVQGRIDREEFAELIDLACRSPNRENPAFFRSEALPRFDPKKHHPEVVDGFVEHYGLYVFSASDGTGQTFHVFCFRSDLPSAFKTPVVEQDFPNVQRHRDVTEIDTPEMPPHRFAMFDKGKGWAYGRGLEINPAHIPAMLDRMEEDGYTLVAALGAQADKVGMIFRRGPRYSALELVHGFGTEPTHYHPRDGGRASEKSDRFLAGEPLDQIAGDPPVAETPERFVIEYAELTSDGATITRRTYDEWPDWLGSFIPCLDRGRGQEP